MADTATTVDDIAVRIGVDGEEGASGLEKLAAVVDKLKSIVKSSLGALGSFDSKLNQSAKSATKLKGALSGIKMPTIPAIPTVPSTPIASKIPKITGQIPEVAKQVPQLGGTQAIMGMNNAYKSGLPSITAYKTQNQQLSSTMASTNAALKSGASSVSTFAASGGKIGQSLASATSSGTKFNQVLAKMDVAIDKVAQSNKKLNSLNFGTKIVAGFYAISQVGRFAKTLFDGLLGQAVHYSEAMNLVAASAGEFGLELERWANAGSAKFGFDPVQLMESAGVMKQIADSTGMVTEKSNKLSVGITQLAYDFASLRDVPIETMLTKFQGALTGEARAVKSLGIDITMAALQEEAHRLGINGKVKTMDQATKMALRYNIMMRSSAVAQGDVGRTLNQPANMLRVLSSQFGIAARSIGYLFIPMLKAVLPYLLWFVKVVNTAVRSLMAAFGITMPSVSDYLSGMPDMANGFEDATEAVDDTGGAIQSATKDLKAMKDYTTGLDELNILKPPEDTSDTGGGGGAGVGGGGVGIDVPIADPYDWLKGMSFDSLIGGVQAKIDKLKVTFSPFIDALGRLWDAFKPFAKNVGEGLWWFVQYVLAPIGKWVINVALVAFLNALSGALEWFNKHPDIARTVGAVAGALLTLSLIKFTAGGLATFVGWIGKLGSGALFSGVGSLVGGIVGLVSNIKLSGGILGAFINQFPMIGGLFATIGGGISTFFGLLSSGSGILGGLTAMFPTLGTVITVLSSPIGWIIAAIALVIAGLVLLYKKSKGFKDIVDTAWNGFKDVIKTAWSAAKPIFDEIKDVIANTIGVFTGLWDTVKAVFSGDWGGAIESIKGVFSNAFAVLESYFIDLPVKLVKWLVDVGVAIGDWALDVSQKVVDWGAAIYDNIVGWFKDLPKTLPKKFEEISTKIKEWAQGLPKKIGEWIKGIPETIKEKIGAWSDIGEKIGAWLDKAWNWLKDNKEKIAKTIAVALGVIVLAVPALLIAIVGVAIFAIGAVIWGLLQAAFEGLKGVFDDLWGGIKTKAEDIWNSIATFFSNLWATITTAVTTAWNGITTYFSNLWTGIKTTATTKWNEFTAWLSGLWTNIKNTATTKWNQFTSWIGGIWSSIKSTAITKWNEVKDYITGIPSRVISGIGNGLETLKNFGKNIIQGMWNGINDKADWIKEKVGDLVKRIIPEPIRKALGIASPSKVVAAITKWVPAGMIVGIESGANAVTKSSIGLASRVVGGIASVVDKSTNSMLNIGRELGTSLGMGIGEGVEGSVSLVSDSLGALSSLTMADMVATTVSGISGANTLAMASTAAVAMPMVPIEPSMTGDSEFVTAVAQAVSEGAQTGTEQGLANAPERPVTLDGKRVGAVLKDNDRKTGDSVIGGLTNNG